MAIYAISDLHLSFSVNKPMNIFGEVWENYEEKIKNEWIARISDNDTVLLSGDLSWGLKLQEAIEDFNFVSRLPGKKIIVKGNHDLWWDSLSKLRKVLPEDIDIIQNNSIKVENTLICGTRGWVCPNDDNFTEHDFKIYNRELMRLENSLKEAKKIGNQDIIVMLHYPPFNNKKEKTGFVDLMEKYSVKACVYGHLHGKAHYMGINGMHNNIEYYLVSGDYLNFRPVLIK